MSKAAAHSPAVREAPNASPTRKGRGGRRPGAGAPRANMNAFKHGLCSDQYDRRLLEASRTSDRALLAHMRELVAAYHNPALTRRRRPELIQQAGLVVLTGWYGLCSALWEEQSNVQIR